MIQKLSWVIKEAFKSSKKSYLSIYNSEARWANKPRKSTLAFDCKDVINLLTWLINNIYVTFGDKCFQQVIGIPMGTDCAPFMANLFLFAYEFQWIDNQRKKKNFEVLKCFKGGCRYIDDLLLINNFDLMNEMMCQIYPKELILVPDDGDGKSTHFLDLNICLKDGLISTSIFDKRDSFDFPIVNFPFLNGNIPRQIANGVFIGELVRYARACTYLEDFTTRTLSLVRKLRTQFYSVGTLKKSWYKFCGNHILLIRNFGIKVLKLHTSWK